jgi:hypothetical protein
LLVCRGYLTIRRAANANFLTERLSLLDNIHYFDKDSRILNVPSVDDTAHDTGLIRLNHTLTDAGASIVEGLAEMEAIVGRSAVRQQR